ncbi:MAG: FtsX-like permease family protein [Bacteroidaceae bacterium]|nr:FtsX-like permease family protein [Bacteroidaceae bacterium]
MKRELLAHYLTVAVRSLGRYRTQSIISIVGLAVGFVCLSLSVLWVNYTNSYNTGYPFLDGERVYVLGSQEKNGDYSTTLPGSLLRDMKEWPEVEARCTVSPQSLIPIGEKGEKAVYISLNPLMKDFFHFDVVAGEKDFWRHIGEKDFMHCDFVLMEPFAWKMFGTEDPIGKTMVVGGNEHTILAIVKPFNKHCNFDCDFMALPPADLYDFEKNEYRGRGMVKLHPGKEVKASFEKKIDEYVDSNPLHVRMIPLRKVAQWMPANLSYAHMRAFLLISILLTVCALINFLTLYLNRLRGRKREMALRLVHGSNHRGLVAMFTVELLVTMGSAILLGMVGVLVLKEPFADFAEIHMGGGYIMGHALLIMLGVLVVCLLMGLGAVEIVRRRTLSSSLNPAAARRHVFSSISTGVQLAVSLCFVFCAVVMLRQLWSMKNADLGVAIKDRGVLTVTYDFVADTNDAMVLVDDNGISEKLEALPEIKDICRGWNFYCIHYMLAGRYNVCLTPQVEPFQTNVFAGIYDPGNPIYGFSVLEGELPRYETWNPSDIVISESIRNRLGLKEALGATLYYGLNKGNKKEYSMGTVVAVVRDVQLKVKSSDKPESFLMLPYKTKGQGVFSPENNILFSYHHGSKKDVETKIRDMMSAFPTLIWDLTFAEDVYNEQIMSEQNLSHLLTIVTAVAILIAVFGVYSIITLACRQRRKEIALRKIHGAKLKDILGMFVREYGIILVISSFVAFAVGYLIMHGWLEQYLKRITIGPQFYVLIFLATALLIALSVGTRVWRTARENPADVIKSE